MPMPSDWVDRLFTRLLVRYGSEWLRRWEGVPIEAVKADWAEELDGMERFPDRMRYALDHLPDRVPTVTEFRAICNRMNGQAQIALPPVKADPARVAAELSRMRGSGRDKAPRGWALELQARDKAGERLTPAQRQMLRAALHHDLGATE